MKNSIKAKVCAGHSGSDSMSLKRCGNFALTMERRKQTVIRSYMEARDFSRVRLHTELIHLYTKIRKLEGQREILRTGAWDCGLTDEERRNDIK